MKDGTMIHKFTTFGKVLAPLCLVVLLLVTACGGNPAVDRLLDTADSLSNVKPDSALRLLDSALPPDSSKNFQSSIFNLPSSRHMRLELLRARCMNKAYVSFTTDSVLLDVVKYYDRHGTPNEQMEAHYLLGCVYRDMGEAPRALDCYLDAIAKADTTAENFDYRAIGSIYAQTARLYQQMMLFSYGLETHRKAAYYDYLAGDTLYAIYEQKMVAGLYIMQNKLDSAEIILNDVIQLYRANGFEREAVLSSTMLMHLYLGKPERQKDLKQLINAFDRYYGLVRDSNELPPSERLYFYYKGRYYEDAGRLDSAEYYYRKVYRPNMPYTSQTPMYSGLLSVFRKKEVADSIARYAQLYCTANDSSVLLKDREITAQQSASYQYSRYQKEAQENGEKARKTERMLIVFFFLTLSVFCLLFLWWKRYRTRQRQEKEKQMRLLRKKQQEMEKLEAELMDVTDRYDKNCLALKLLEESHKAVVNSVQERLDGAQTAIDELNREYQDNISLFKNENESLKKKIDELSSQKNMAALMEKSIQFEEEPIVKRIIELSEDPKQHIRKREWDELVFTVGRYYPELLKDLEEAPSGTPQDMHAALLVLLNVRTDDLARLLHVSGQRATNIKSDLNLTLFGVKSARPLYENMKSRYSIYLFGK